MLRLNLFNLPPPNNVPQKHWHGNEKLLADFSCLKPAHLASSMVLLKPLSAGLTVGFAKLIAEVLSDLRIGLQHPPQAFQIFTTTGLQTDYEFLIHRNLVQNIYAIIRGNQQEIPTSTVV